VAVSPESPPPRRAVVVAARNEADRIVDTLRALRRAFPDARLIVADDGSTDSTSRLAADEGAELASREGGRPRRGKGGALTAATRLALAGDPGGTPTIVLLCDGDLGATAANLTALVERVESGGCDLAIAVFARREGGGFGVAVGFARWAVERLTGQRLRAPISGQRALRAGLLPSLLPFAAGFGVETAMDIDAARAGARIEEVEVDLDHRVTRRDVAGFLHRARQLVDFALAFASRRIRRR
jgi:glycosyltransferase involved in cell wall biosynthesis